jgi:Lrp/AsnC family transcriptional regulator
MLPPSIVNDAALLQADATCSTPEVAESIHPSRWCRIKRTDHKDIIKKRVALHVPAKLRVGVTVFVSVRTGDHTEKWLVTFAAACARCPR